MDPLADDPRVRGREHHVLGERAVDIHAEDAEVLADVRTAGPARGAPSARDVRLRGDERAGLQVMHLGDPTASTVPATSCPNVIGIRRIRFSAHSFQSKICRSVPQIEAPCTRTSDLVLTGRRDRDLDQLGAAAWERSCARARIVTVIWAA